MHLFWYFSRASSLTVTSFDWNLLHCFLSKLFLYPFTFLCCIAKCLVFSCHVLTDLKLIVAGHLILWSGITTHCRKLIMFIRPQFAIYVSCMFDILRASSTVTVSLFLQDKMLLFTLQPILQTQNFSKFILKLLQCFSTREKTTRKKKKKKRNVWMTDGVKEKII